MRAQNLDGLACCDCTYLRFSEFAAFDFYIDLAAKGLQLLDLEFVLDEEALEHKRNRWGV